MEKETFTGLSSLVLATLVGAFLGAHSFSFGNGPKCLLPKETFLAASFLASQIQDDVRIPIVVYHSVRPYQRGESEYQDLYDITPELFEKQLSYLNKNGFTTISFSAVADYFDNSTPLPEKPIILSFDDSWGNQYEYAFPLLKEYKTTGTFFVFTNSLSRGKHLTWNEVREMQKAGMEIGSHTKTHPFLDDIKDETLLRKEISGSKEILEESLGTPIRSFAYPFGEHESESLKEVENAGYKVARTLRKGTLQKESERYQMPAFLVTDDLADFIRKVNQ